MTRKQSTLPQSLDQLIGRARAVAERWRASLRGGVRAAADASANGQSLASAASAPLEDLREQLTALETDIARIQRERDELQARNQPIEERAMAAIRAGDDRSAKIALEQLHATADADALLEVDLTVLRALVDECRDFLATVDPAASPDSSGPHRA